MKHLNTKHTIIVLNKLNLSWERYDSIGQAAVSLGLRRSTLMYFIKTGKLSKNIYQIIRLIKIHELEFEFEKDKDRAGASELRSQIFKSKTKSYKKNK